MCTQHCETVTLHCILTRVLVVRDGDVYAALRDCYTALQLDVNHVKAHFRLARCLYELSWTTEALECLLIFKAKFPDSASSKTCEALEKDIRAAIFSKNSGKLFYSLLFVSLEYVISIYML